MVGIDKIRNQIKELDDEFYSMSSLYNLHIIEVKNTFNNALLEAYLEKCSEEYTLATFLNTNQVLLYNTNSQIEKVYNFSLEMFSNTWKIFIKKIEILSISNSSKLFSSTFDDSSFLKAKIVKTTTKNIYYRLNSNTSIHTRNIHFSYKPKSIIERNFLLKKEDNWVHITDSLAHKIKSNSQEIASLKIPIVFKTNPFNSSFIHIVSSDITDRIRKKSAGKVNIKTVNINEATREVMLACDMFLPIAFMEYIKEYIYTNTLYKVNYNALKSTK